MGSVTIEASYLVAIVLAGHAARWSWSRLNASGRIGLIVLAVVKLIEWCIVEGLSAPGPAQSSGLVAYCVLSCLATVSAARYVVRPSIASPSDGGR